MRNWRVALFSFFICLPAALVISACAWLIVDNIPRAIRTEPSRIGKEYRDVAEDLIAHPDKAEHKGPRVAGWRQVSKINGTPWGYAVNGDRTTVWFKNGEKEWRWTEIDAITPFPYALVFYFGGGVAAIVLIFLTAMTLASSTTAQDGAFHRVSARKQVRARAKSARPAMALTKTGS